MVLLLLIRCWLLLPLWDSVIVLCFVVRYFMSILVLQSSWWGRESWLLYFVCLPGVSWLLCGFSSRCHGFVYIKLGKESYAVSYNKPTGEFFFLLTSGLVNPLKWYLPQLRLSEHHFCQVDKTGKWVWSGNNTSIHCRPIHGTPRKSQRICIVTRLL